jgi:hypothetical protein
MNCFREPKITPFEHVIKDVVLAPLKKQIILERYNRLTQELQQQTWRVAVCFHTSRTIITVGSLIVPALLSIQYTNSNTNLSIYWTTWVISLLVTVCNGLSTLLKLDRHYYHLHTVRERLISDGWQYLELTGKYSGFYTPNKAPSHENQFVYFSHSIEKIRMLQIQEEYLKDAQGQPEHAHNGERGKEQEGEEARAQASQRGNQFLPPTPQEGALDTISNEVKQAMEELSQTTIVNGQGAPA